MWNVPTFTEVEFWRNANGNAGVIGSCRCTMSNRSRRSSLRTFGSSHTENVMRATAPPLGTGTGLPMGMNPGSSLRSLEFASGPTTVTACPFARSSRARLFTWSFTPPGVPKSYGETSAIFNVAWFSLRGGMR